MKKLSMILFAFMLAGCGTTAPDENSGSLKVSEDVEFGEKDFKKIISPSNQLGWKLLPQVEANDEGNTFISPMSLFMAVSMVYNGADGETKDEIAEVLEVPGMEAVELNKANASLMKGLANDSEEIELNIGNSIWLNDRYTFQEGFECDTQDYFNAEIEAFDMGDSESPKRINGWVEDATNGKIKEMVKDPLDPNLVALLLNAVYFKGDWQLPFEEKNTEEKRFYLEDGTEKEVPLMMLREELGYLETDGFQAVSLPYGEGEMSMKVFLPKEGSTLAEFQKTLTNENWGKWDAAFEQRMGTLQLPKFQIEYEAELNDALIALGMEKAFNPAEAEFTEMVEGSDSLFIDEVKQKTYLDVNEEGTEAAAVTSIAMEESAGSAIEPFNMEVNRPFFITIIDEETGLVLFMGTIADPGSEE